MAHCANYRQPVGVRNPIGAESKEGKKGRAVNQSRRRAPDSKEFFFGSPMVLVR
ncbi:MAG: hypothetical protein K0S45_3217 [Nitrospira sp.]|nr:hypothetical protein [Nitrospira sp.]